MASFPELRSCVRSATVERRRLPRYRSPALVRAVAVVFTSACSAVSELATPRGAKASVRSAFLTRARRLRAGAAFLGGDRTSERTEA